MRALIEDIALLVACLASLTPTTAATRSSHWNGIHGKHHKRNDCTTTQVVSGDSCAAVATRCKISGNDLTKYNPDPDLCSTLTPGQHVCCSAGTLPDLSPKTQGNGTCATHKVAKDETCSSIAGSNSISVKDIESWNAMTWQFSGCDALQTGQVICLSKGDPPMPAPMENAICGPQVPGTQIPANMSSEGALASLNPCPLNACCTIWGQCGVTPEFCTKSNSSTGAPGTAAPRENGCIQNCGTDIIQSDSPAAPIKIGYYEAFSMDRPCLYMEPSQIDTKKYTHLHFAFANISEDYKLQMYGSIAAQWDKFKDISGPKRILSFGGWSFSTSADTYPIFRNAVTKEKRDTFIKSLTQFVDNSGIDGLDFDWEYPGAPDIPGIPSGDKDDGERYLQFLKDLRDALPSEKSLSIAAPASYWYLKGFPIAEISKVVDYIVYMTYDLHGQWDYNNSWSQPGCPAGDCLRSHVNLTETNTALAMITKAGVPSNKIAVGVSSYGRSFKMTQAGCTSPNCTYTGPESGAKAGPCTKTKGYIANAEIEQILKLDSTAKTFHDGGSNSDIMVYQDTEWIAYMSEVTKATRRDYYLGMNFLGTIDWAVDLAEFVGGPEDEDDGNDDKPYEPLPNCYDADKYHTVDDVINDSKIPENCVNTYLLSAMAETMSTSLANYTDIMNHGYKSKYDAFVKQVHETAPLQFDNFYHEKINDFFTCQYAVPSKKKNTYTNTTGGCPPNDIPKEFEGRAYNVFFVVNDEDAFCEEIEDNYGLNCDWIEYTSVRTTPCFNDNHCADWGNLYSPGVKPNFDVPDPGEAITQSLSNYTGLSDWISESALISQVSLFMAEEVDAVDGASSAVFSTQAAVAAMQRVADAGEKAKEEERKQMILAFVSAILLVIPALGETIGTLVDIAAIARIAALAGDVGNGALALYSVAEDPESAPMVIMGGLLGGVARRDNDVWGKAGTVRREMSEEVIAKMGDDVASNMNKLQKARKACAA